MMSIKDIVDIFSQVCINHKNINTFKTGDAFQRAVNGNDAYPLAYLVQDFQIQTASNGATSFETHSITLEILDLPKQGEDTSIDMLTDMHSTGLEIIKKISEDYKQQVITADTIIATTVSQYTDDNCTGVIFEFEVKTPKQPICTDGRFD